MPFPSALAHIAPQRTWIGWRWGRPKGAKNAAKLTKIPCDAGGRAVSSADPANLRTYTDLWDALSHQVINGVALASIGNDGSRIVLDLDKCRDPETGACTAAAQGIVDACDSYAEVSPSGRGIRIVGSAEGWDPAETQRRWEAAGLRGETFFSTGFATITFRALPGHEGLWMPIGGLAAGLPSRSGKKLRDIEPGVAAEADPVAPVEVVRETLAAIPNPEPGEGSDWERWNAVGMRVFRATAGADEGLEAWLEWSARYDGYGGSDTCEARWEHWSRSSPPTHGGYGTLHWMAAQATPGWAGGQTWSAWHAARNAGRVKVGEGMGALPEGEGVDFKNPIDLKNAVPIGKTTTGEPAVIRVGTVLHETVNETEAAVEDGGFAVFQRAGKLVRPVVAVAHAVGGRRTTTAAFRVIRAAEARDLMSKAARWEQWDGRMNKWKGVWPPKDIAEVWIAREGAWRARAAAVAVVAPTLRPDGSIISEPGLDEATGIYLADNPLLRMPEGWDKPAPSRTDAETALALLDSLLDEFPFSAPMDRSIALAAILTPAVRGALEASPLFVFDAPQPGSGKSYLVDVCAAVTTGGPPPVSTASAKEDETEKRLGALLLAGVPVAVLDNVNGEIKGDFLCQSTERPAVSIRILGLSEQRVVDNRTCIFATGNNISVRADLVRRSMVCVLDANMERPELRRFQGDPLGDVITNQGKYLAAALTVVRAHAVAGFPGTVDIVRLASFGRWDRFVRGALVWLGRADPLDTMARTRSADPDVADLRDLLAAWSRRFGVGERGARSVHQVLEGAMNGTMGAVQGRGDAVVQINRDNGTGTAEDIRDVLLRIGADRRGGIDPQKVGFWLRRHAGQTVGNLKLVRIGHARTNSGKWGVETTLRPV